MSKYMCKILEGKRFYWAAAGPIYIDPTTGFEVERLVRTVGSKGTLLNKMKTLVANTKEPLARELASIRKDNPSAYTKIVAGQKALLEVVFAAIEKGHPTYVWVNFIAREVGETIQVDGDPIEALEPTADNPSSVLCLGEYKEAMAYLQSHGGSLLNDH
jgi:hypothetical protein